MTALTSGPNERTNDDRIVFSLEDSGGFPPEEEKSEFQLKTEENCKLQTAQGMLHCYMKPGGRSWLEKVPVAEETTNYVNASIPKDFMLSSKNRKSFHNMKSFLFENPNIPKCF